MQTWKSASRKLRCATSSVAIAARLKRGPHIFQGGLDDIPAPAWTDMNQPARLQPDQRLANNGARNAKHASERLFADPGARAQAAGKDGVDNGPVDGNGGLVHATRPQILYTRFVSNNRATSRAGPGFKPLIAVALS
jgi:hypothetical protein